MIQSDNPETQTLVAMLEKQRDDAVIEAATCAGRVAGLQKQVEELTVKATDGATAAADVARLKVALEKIRAILSTHMEPAEALLIALREARSALQEGPQEPSKDVKGGEGSGGAANAA